MLTVNAKNHPSPNTWAGGDVLMAKGQRLPYIRNIRNQAKRAGGLLTEQVGFPVTVLSVITVIGAHTGFKIKKQPEDSEVASVQRCRIGQYVKNPPRLPNDREVEAIYQNRSRLTTWR